LFPSSKKGGFDTSTSSARALSPRASTSARSLSDRDSDCIEGNIPELRFPGFSTSTGSATEWVEKRLGEVADTYFQGINTTADEIPYTKSGVPIIQAKHMTDEILSFEDIRYVSDTTYFKYKKKYQPKIGDILISNIGTLGKIVLIKQEVDFLIAWNIFKFQLDNQKCVPCYIEMLLKQISQNGYFERMKTGNATKFVNKSDMINIKLYLPSLPEQQKIANFLTTVDDKITQVDQQIEKTTQFKKGLLQQMFV